MSTSRGVPCTLFRKKPQEEWHQYQASACSLSISGIGLTVRSSQDSSLLLDIPYPVIKKCDKLKNLVIRFTMTSNKSLQIADGGQDCFYALQFKKPVDMTELERVLKQKGIKLQVLDTVDTKAASMADDVYPDVRNPEVQQYMLKLLFSSKFKELCSDVKQFLEAVEDRG
jgi:hypothetical protein